MKGELVWSIFWALVGVFVVVAAVVVSAAFTPAVKSLLVDGWFFIISGAILILLSVALIFFTVRAKAGGLSDKFLILTGASSAGVIVSVILHNVLYGLFIYWLGADFWERVGLGDEPFFFILATIICPLGFLVGAVGSVVLFIKKVRGGAGKLV